MDEYIERGAAYEAIMSDPPDAHYQSWYAEKIKAIPAADVEPVQEWISVEDMLPEDDSDVLAYSSIGEESRIYPACYSNGVWFDCVFNAPATDTTTHWMKMPQPPKGE